MTDRLPPHAPDAEMAIIGCCLTEPVECLPLAQETIVSALFFYDARNQTVWDVMNALEADKVDLIIVSQKLKDAGTSIPLDYLSKCQDAAWSTANLPYWLEELTEKYTLRQLITVASNITGACYQAQSVEAVIDFAETNILKIRPQKREHKDMRALVHEAIGQIEKRYKNGGAITGLTTGLHDLNALTDGLHQSEMIVIAGFPSTGKTCLAVNIAVTNALAKVPAAIFSAEMRPVQLVVRSICSEAKVDFHHVRDYHGPQLTDAVKKLSIAPLYIEQANGFTIGQVSAQARRLKQKHGIQLAVIDYIQLLGGRGDNREQEISSISKGIKAMAVELDIPVIALSQLNDDGKLRESRAIGQDADTVWKLANDGEWKHDIQPINLNVDKCREGSTGQVKLTFLKTITRFESQSKIETKDMPYHDD